MDSPFSLKDKTVLITGASSGIGRACAIECAKLGAKIILTARDEKRLAETRSQLPGEGHAVIPADLSDDAGIEKLAGAISVPLDGIVLNAGICKFRPFAFVARKNLDELMQTNVFAPLVLTRTLLKKNVLKDGSSIVFISSIVGTSVAGTGLTAYATSKAAISGAAKNMASELAARKIRVNCVCPGTIETPMSEVLTAEERATDIKRYPLGRYGSPEEVAYGVIYFLSNVATWTTGSELVIDGGRTLL